MSAARPPTRQAAGRPARRQCYRPRQTTPTDNRRQRAKQYWPIRRASNARWSSSSSSSIGLHTKLLLQVRQTTSWEMAHCCRTLTVYAPTVIVVMLTLHLPNISTSQWRPLWLTTAQWAWQTWRHRHVTWQAGLPVLLLATYGRRQRQQPFYRCRRRHKTRPISTSKRSVSRCSRSDYSSYYPIYTTKPNYDKTEFDCTTGRTTCDMQRSAAPAPARGPGDATRKITPPGRGCSQGFS